MNYVMVNVLCPVDLKTLDDAGMAVKLYQARKRQQRPEQDPSQDYIEER
jgi:hypothetical protein